MISVFYDYSLYGIKIDIQFFFEKSQALSGNSQQLHLLYTFLF